MTSRGTGARRTPNVEQAHFAELLAERLKRFLVLDKAPDYRTRVSFAALATHFGLRGWRRPGRSHQSLVRLVVLAGERGPEILGTFVRMAVKRGTRHYRSREDWSRKKWSVAAFRQPIWREQVEEIIALLKEYGIPVRDLADVRFLRSLPRRGDWLGAVSGCSGWTSRGP